MAEEPEPDEPSNDPDEEGSDRSTTGDPEPEREDEPSTDEDPTEDEPSDGNETESATDDGADEPDSAPEDRTEDQGDEIGPVIDPLGETGPTQEEWLGWDTPDETDGEEGAESGGGADLEAEADSDVETDSGNDSEGEPDDDEPSEGELTRVDDGDGNETGRSPVDRPEAEAPPDRTRSGHPDATPAPPEHGAMAPGSQSEGRLGDDTDDHGTADEIDAETDAHQEPSSEPVPDWDEEEAWDGDETEDFDQSEDLMEQYKAQEELLEPPDQQLVEPEAEPEIEDAEPGGVLDRDRDGPPDDQEMPLTEHIEEMVKRLGIVVVMAAVVTTLAWPFSEGATLHIWSAVLPTADAPDPHLYGPLEKILTQIKVAGLAGLLIALPMVVYQTYRFMRPGLYPHERRYYLAAVPTSLVLAAAGMAFSYFLVLPTLFVYFMYYTEGSVDIVAFGLSKTFNLIVTLTGVLAIVFQIPLFIMLAIMMGVTSRHWLASKRIYFWAGFAGASFLIAPDPTGMAPFLVAGTAIGLFEGTLFLLKWVKRGRRRYRRSREDGA